MSKIEDKNPDDSIAVSRTTPIAKVEECRDQSIQADLRIVTSWQSMAG
jgi:hypothetical protein